MKFSLLPGLVAITVQFTAHAAPVSKAAETFPLGEVQLLDSRFKENMERNAKYLLSLDPDRLLHNTRLYCGLQPKGDVYAGWESRGVAGHTLGHYLTAISQQYAATGDNRFKDRVDYIVSEMAECQARYGDGYIGALPPLELRVLRDLAKGSVDFNGSSYLGGAWVPWYTEHKILAGLKDAWLLTGNLQAKDVAMKLADFVDKATSALSPEQQQQMLKVEFGGMNETLVEMYALTGRQRYLDASRRFYKKAVMDPLAAGKDPLPGLHANTHIPQVIGEAVRYEATGDENGKKIAENFWDLVTGKYTFAIGGNSDREHFFPAEKTGEHLSPETAETCNTYNMLKLTEHLMEWKPSAEYGDYYERALYNDILASQDPDTGMFTYFMSLEPGHFRTFSTPTDSFWCCVDTGMENHTKYGEAIYFHGGDDLYVNLFIPSVLNWKEKGVTLRQQTDYPQSGRTELTFESAPATPLALRIRCPGWAAGPVTFELNGQPLAVSGSPGSFARIERTWKAGDKLAVSIPMNLRTEGLEDTPGKLAIFYGPLLLAGDLGPAPKSPTFPLSVSQTANDRAPDAPVPVLVAENTSALLQGLQRVRGPKLAFRTVGLGRPNEVTLRPFNDMPYEYYNVYWDVLSAADWDKRRAAIEREEQQRRQEAARIVDEFAPGEQQSEVDHGFTSSRSRTGDIVGRKWRDAASGGFFAFQMKVLANAPQMLRCTYWGNDAGTRAFDILIDGKLLATQTLARNEPGELFSVETPLPDGLIAGKEKVTVRFQPHEGNIAGGLFGCAVLKAKSGN